MMFSLPQALLDPPREFTLFPFWFWNDDLSEAEIIRQMDDFQAHGICGFIIHPRVGLPRSIGWMSDRMLAFIRFAVEEAARRKMWVMLYNEGMYPSGSSSGQVVATNPAFQCRCLAKQELAPGAQIRLSAGQNLVARFDHPDGSTTAIIDRPVDAYIRGLHYISDKAVGSQPAEEDEPAAGDILNPQAVACFLRLVYDRYAEVLSDHFGKTILGIFTDEPSLLGRCREKDVLPGTTGIIERVSAFLGYDFTPHLPALWDEREPDSRVYREDYERALTYCLEESYYRPLHDWCRRHGIALIGHPALPDAIGLMRYFDIPGQDLVWRWVLPGEKSALEGPESTQAKCSSSAMLHLGRERNSNECFGAYGHQFTWQEMKWLVDWCFVRGMHYPAVILDSFDPFPAEAAQALTLLAKHGRLILWNAAPASLEHSGAVRPVTETDLVSSLQHLTLPDLLVDGPQPELRIRHLIKEGMHYYLLANEGLETIHLRITVPIQGSKLLLDPYTSQVELLDAPGTVDLAPYTLKIILSPAQAA